MAEYEIFAIRYAWRDAKRSDHFIGGDPHDGPMPMDYFTWVIRGEGRTIVVDTGFTAEVSAKRGRTHLRCPIETLPELGIDPDSVEDVVLTHLHYDHVGNWDRFPKARFHLQDKEMQFATGRHMCKDPFRHAYEVEDVVAHLKTQGTPEYLEAITAFDDDDGEEGGDPIAGIGDEESADLYERAVAVVLRDSKASTSYI